MSYLISGSIRDIDGEMTNYSLLFLDKHQHVSSLLLTLENSKDNKGAITVFGVLGNIDHKEIWKVRNYVFEDRTDEDDEADNEGFDDDTLIFAVSVAASGTPEDMGEWLVEAVGKVFAQNDMHYNVAISVSG